ncbi:MAG: class I SAM-dependent methyltransferase [Ramlibacter sp.]|nr:class I SAM-dependent methyltransferase [Ramlibacter sp.]
MKPPVTQAGWSAEMRALHRHDMQEIWDRSLAPQIWNQYHNQLDLYLGIAGDEPLDILDVGCAQGTLALLLAERGHRVTAVDLRPEFLAYAQSRHTHGQVHFLQANAVEEDIPGQYDLVFTNQLVEHLVYPRQFIERLLRNLRPGGLLVVTTPNGQYVRNHLPSFTELGDPRQWEHLQYTADGDGHFYAYRAGELNDILVAAGLLQVRTRFFESPMISGHMKVRHLHGLVPVGALRALDRVMLSIPWLGRRLAHQLMVMGRAAP